MERDFVIGLCREALLVTLILSAPALLASLVVGLAVSLFQATTQIQEQTLSFVPKMVAVFLVLLLSGNWLIAETVKFSMRLFEQLPRAVSSFQ